MNLVTKKATTNEKFLLWGKITFFSKIISLYNIDNLCVVIEIYASCFFLWLKIMSRNTISEPQPDSASYEG